MTLQMSKCIWRHTGFTQKDVEPVVWNDESMTVGSSWQEMMAAPWLYSAPGTVLRAFVLSSDLILTLVCGSGDLG